MKCELKNRDQLIVDYVTDDLPEEAAATFETHYFSCQTCFQALRLAADAVHIIEREGSKPLKVKRSRLENLLKRLKIEFGPQGGRGILKPAFLIPIILLTVGLSVLIWQFAEKSAPLDKFTANFQHSAYLDNLISQTYQSSTAIQGVEPENDVNFNGEMLFKWQFPGDERQQPNGLELRILNNKEQELYGFLVEGMKFSFEDQIDPGVYYWALLSEEEMLYLGRFTYQKR